MRTKYWRSTTKYFFKEHIFRECDSAEKAYWLGFIMADGCVVDTGKCYQLIIEINKRDEELLNQLIKFIDGNMNISYEKDNLVRLRLYSKKLVKDLAKYGIIPRKTGKECIRNISTKYVRDFIRGYFDGDGCIFTVRDQVERKRWKEKRFSIASFNEKFLQNIQKILMKNCSLNKTKINNCNHSLVYQGSKQIKRIFHYLYDNADMYLERKHEAWSK